MIRDRNKVEIHVRIDFDRAVQDEFLKWIPSCESATIVIPLIFSRYVGVLERRRDQRILPSIVEYGPTSLSLLWAEYCGLPQNLGI